jgi:phosphohistidine phosphatase
MMVYLVRHGKAEVGERDELRRLNDRGRKSVQRVAARLRETGVHVRRVEHSGLVRAAETAEILAKAVGGKAVEVPGLRPMDDVRAMAAALAGRPEREVMLVGHMPFMGRLASYLLTGEEREVLHFRTAAAACLSDVEGRWLVEWLLPPDLASL